MIQSAIMAVAQFGFLASAPKSRPAEIQSRAYALLSQLDDLAQQGDPEAFKLALLEQAGMLVACARAHGDTVGWLAAFRKGLDSGREFDVAELG